MNLTFAMMLRKIQGATIPADIFSKDSSKMNQEYSMFMQELVGRAYAHRIELSPDELEEARQKIISLYEEGKKQLETGNWVYPAGVTFTSIDGKSIHFSYKLLKSQNGIEIYICEKEVYIRFKKEQEDFFRRFVANTKFSYSKDKIKEMMKYTLPNVVSYNELTDGTYLIKIKKDEEMLPLSDVIENLGGKLEVHHIAWIITRLFEFISYMQTNMRMAHCGITINNCFIMPRTHRINVIGGWFNATTLNEQLKYMPEEVYNVLTKDILASKRATIGIDILAIKGLAKSLFDEKDDASKEVNIRPFIDWLYEIPEDNAILEFEKWEKVRESVFGKREFIALDVNPYSIYNG